ncbi:putative -beta- protein [Eutypa lata UCREL1]|uniref:1,3-beta-glucanosyltransferase n=1 Tax=Eutypa lata (strain UCR-EL1) TaxID=1287681 RepID=M7TB61_EUTLA|nr:putative -beta- protein [Eutypa lata UCREL1]
MRASSILPYLSVGAATISGAAAADASYDTIPAIEVYGQHFFYTNNGSQFYMKGVAYQQGYNPTGASKRADSTVEYTDPLADASSCSRDIPYMKQIFTNVIRVYAIDPTADHDDCMQQLADNDIYVVADLSEPNTSIDSSDPEWNVPLFQRYAAVVDALEKYQNVIGFFAGNEVVSRANETAAAAFVKAAVRDTKGYIKSQGYRASLGVGYATADVPSRDDLADYFACQPDDTGNATSIDFWGYNVYSWCGDSTYQESSYGERVDFFSDYPVPVFFAEYGCIEGIDGGATHRPFTEVEVLYGNMTEVFSGGIVYEWFMEDNNYGLVSIDGDSVSPYPDFTSLKNQLKTVSPTITQSSEYTPSNTAPACPTVYSSWAAMPSPLPPAVNPQLCECEMSAVSCSVASDDSSDYGDAFGFICGAGDYCNAIEHNATTGAYGAISGCSPKQQLAFVANLYYQDQDQASDACDFNGVASTQAATTADTCTSLLEAAGTDGAGTVPSPTDAQGTDGAAASSSSEGAAISGFNAPSFFNYGKVLFVGYVALAIVSAVGIVVL